MLGHLAVSGDHSLYIFYFNFTFGYVRGPGVSFWRWVLEKPAYLGAFCVQPVLLAMEELNLSSSADVRNLFSLLMLPKFNPLHLLLLWLGWIFPRVSSVDTQLKVNEMGGVFSSRFLWPSHAKSHNEVWPIPPFHNWVCPGQTCHQLWSMAFALSQLHLGMGDV